MSTPVPDKPESFGYKCSWLAVRTDSSAAVVAALSLQNPVPSTWSAGVEKAYADHIFVTPPLKGWVLAAGVSLPDSGDANHADRITPLLLRLGSQFSEVQYFGTHRVVEWHAWARVVGGTLVRRFAYVGDQGRLIWNDGAPTPDEQALDIAFTPASLEEGSSPDEDNVMALAARWSVDPSTLEDEDLEPSLGVVGEYPR